MLAFLLETPEGLWGLPPSLVDDGEYILISAPTPIQGRPPLPSEALDAFRREHPGLQAASAKQLAQVRVDGKAVFLFVIRVDSPRTASRLVWRHPREWSRSALSGHVVDSLTLSCLFVASQRHFGEPAASYDLAARFSLSDFKGGDYFNEWYAAAMEKSSHWGISIEFEQAPPGISIFGSTLLTASEIDDVRDLLFDAANHLTGRFWVSETVSGQEFIRDFLDPKERQKISKAMSASEL